MVSESERRTRLQLVDNDPTWETVEWMRDTLTSDKGLDEKKVNKLLNTYSKPLQEYVGGLSSFRHRMLRFKETDASRLAYKTGALLSLESVKKYRRGIGEWMIQPTDLDLVKQFEQLLIGNGGQNDLRRLIDFVWKNKPKNTIRHIRPNGFLKALGKTGLPKGLGERLRSSINETWAQERMDLINEAPQIAYQVKYGPHIDFFGPNPHLENGATDGFHIARSSFARSMDLRELHTMEEASLNLQLESIPPQEKI